MRTIVVDDEGWMIKHFVEECQGLPDIQLVGSFQNPLKALEFAQNNGVDLAFLDVEMPELNGLELATKLREIYPQLIIIFISAYEQYMPEAFKTKSADYYIVKPYSTEDIEAAVDRAKLLSGRLIKKLSARTFGTFELFLDGEPIVFSDNKEKEFFALMVDRQGGVLTLKEACSVLYPDSQQDENAVMETRHLLRNLQKTLKCAKLDSVIGQNDQGVFLHTEAMDCDLFKYIAGDLASMRSFNGEYMTGYDWAVPMRDKLREQNQLLASYDQTQIRNTLCASIRILGDESLTLTYMNESFLAVMGYTREEVKEKFHNSLRAMILREDFKKAIEQGRELLAFGKPLEAEFRLVTKAGDEIWVLGKSEPPHKSNIPDVQEFSCILIDISGIKSEVSHWEQTAQHDTLTGLYNRGSAQDKIIEYLANSTDEPSGALILMDVDRFKLVDDTYGHPFADTVLTDIAAILMRSFRSSDIVGRLGGDEMMIFLKDVRTEANARTELQATTDAIRKRLSSKTERGELSCSFGGVICPDDGSDFETLYQRADLALYVAKEKRNSTVWFSDVRMRVVDRLIAREVTEIQPSDKRGPESSLFENLQNRLATATDLLQEIATALAEIGKYYDVSRAYIFEFAKDQRIAVNTFEWCACEAKPEINNLKALPTDELAPYYDFLFGQDNLFYCYDIRTLQEPLYDILEPQGIKSMLQRALTCDGEYFGMVGFDECRTRRYWNGRQIKILDDFTKILGKQLHAYRQTHGSSLSELQKGAIGLWEKDHTEKWGHQNLSGKLQNISGST